MPTTVNVILVLRVFRASCPTSAQKLKTFVFTDIMGLFQCVDSGAISV